MNRWSTCLISCMGMLMSATALAEDRLVLTANGSTLTDTDGGGGGSVSWLHNFNPSTLAGIGAEYQKLADAQWQFGILNGAYTGGREGKRWTVYGDARKGTGDDAGRDFNYQSVTVGVNLPLYRRLSLELEDKQIDIDTTHGNLPRVGLSLLWNNRLQTSVSYAHSVGGNLGTELSSARLDYYGSRLHFILGGAYGPANTVVLNLPIDTDFPNRSVRQGFIGISRRYARAEFLMLGDYLSIGDSKRATLTLSCTIHLNSPGKPK